MVAPEPIVKFKTDGEVSKFTTTPVGTETTAKLEFGTPPHQFPAIFQSSLLSPIHVPLPFIVTATLVLVVLSHPETV